MTNPLAQQDAIEQIALRAMNRLEEDEADEAGSLRLVPTPVPATLTEDDEQPSCLERPPLRAIDIKEVTDALSRRIHNPDEYLVEFIVARRVAELWRVYLRGDDVEGMNRLIGR